MFTMKHLAFVPSQFVFIPTHLLSLASMPSPIYLDNNATTCPLPEVVAAMDRVWRDAFANPGSRHAAGRAARRMLETSRESIARILDSEPEEVVFTSGGTESINLAIRGLARSPGTIATGPGEHPATAETITALVQRGWSHHELPVDAAGRLVDDAAEQCLARVDTSVRLVSLLLAHNETGVLQNSGPLIERFNNAGVPTHLDAVQAVGKIPVSFKQLGATALSFGAHKFHGPRGIGGMLVRRGVKLTPLHHGGHQESERRPGTEPVALIAGMAAALEAWHRDQYERMQRMVTARDQLESRISERCPPVVINGRSAGRLPNTSSIAFPGLDGEALLVALDLEGIACSLGSTCASGSAEPAPILLAMRVSPEIALSTVRLSVSFETALDDIEEAVERIANVVERLRGR